MSLLSTTLRLLTDAAHASLDDIGSRNPGVSEMWQALRNTFYTNQDPVTSISSAVVNSLFPMVGGVAVILVIYAGIKMITAQGKEDQVSKAKAIIFYALLAVIIALLATTIVAFVINVAIPMIFGG